jgi:hypothetical protein
MTSVKPTYIDIGHRMLWADFTTNSLFGYRPPPLAPIIHVGVPLNDPEPVRIFNQRRHKARQQQNIPNQIFWLEQRAINKTFDQGDALLYEHILDVDDQLREQCKHNLRKKYAGQVLYSDVIGKDRKELHLWSLILNRLQQRRVDTRKIRRLMHITGQHRALQMELPAALRAQTACKQLYRLHETQAKELHQAFKLKVKEHRAIKFQTSVETQQKIAQNAFKSKNSFSRIRKVIQKKKLKIYYL